MRLLSTVTGAVALAFASIATPATAAGDTVVMNLKAGDVTIKLRPDLAPGHVERIKALASQKFYDGVIFHRVLPGFMAQTGDPTGTGTGGSKLPDLKAEFSKERFGRGTVAAARTSDPDSANSQFFICFSLNGCAHLRGKYTIWGRVSGGMTHIDNVAKNGTPGFPTKIISMRVK